VTTGGTLVANGQSHQLGCEIKNWHDHGMQFSWKEGGARSRPNDPSLIVGHWTGGESSGGTLFRNIRRRKTKDGRGLSVHLYIDYHGTVWQYCDLMLSTRHAGDANAPSIGIEMQNRAWDPKKLPASWRKFDRGKIRITLKGRAITVLSFTSAQLESWVTLVAAISDLYDIPRVLPGDPALVAQGANASGLVMPDQLTKKQWQSFAGTLGHYHISSSRLDPGLQPLEALVDEGWTPIVVR